MRTLDDFYHLSISALKHQIGAQSFGGGTRIAACNRYHRLIYVFSIFNVPANVPADLSRLGLLEA